MKHWVRLASHFYPAAWRQRYATEFDAMLDQVDPGRKDVLDILKGALTMQFTSWNLKSIVLTFAAIGMVIAAATALSIPTEYRSMTVLRFSPAGAAQGNAQIAQYISEMEPEILSRTSLERMITGYDLYKSQRKDRPMEDIVQDMRTHDIAIKMMVREGERHGDQAAFSVSYVYPDPKLAQAVTRDLVTKFTEQNVRSQGGGDIRNPMNLEILDPPSDPERPISPNKGALIFAGLFAGLTVGLIVSYALRWRITIVRRPA